MIQEKGAIGRSIPFRCTSLDPNQYPASGKKKKAQQPFKVSSITETLFLWRDLKRFLRSFGFTWNPFLRRWTWRQNQSLTRISFWGICWIIQFKSTHPTCKSTVGGGAFCYASRRYDLVNMMILFIGTPTQTLTIPAIQLQVSPKISATSQKPDNVLTLVGGFQGRPHTESPLDLQQQKSYSPAHDLTMASKNDTYTPQINLLPGFSDQPGVGKPTLQDIFSTSNPLTCVNPNQVHLQEFNLSHGSPHQSLHQDFANVFPRSDEFSDEYHKTDPTLFAAASGKECGMDPDGTQRSGWRDCRHG